MPITDQARQLANAVITRKLSIYFLLCGLFFTVFIASFLIYTEYDQAVHTARKTIEYVKLGYLQPVSSSLYKMDQYQLESELQGIMRLHPIVRVEVTEERAHGLMVSLGREGGRFATEERFPLTHEVGGKTVRIGTLSVTYSMEFLYRGLIRQAIWILFVAIVLGLAILVVFLYFFNRIVVSPLLTITDFALT